jgi:hypothetical protein
MALSLKAVGAGLKGNLEVPSLAITVKELKEVGHKSHSLNNRICILLRCCTVFRLLLFRCPSDNDKR